MSIDELDKYCTKNLAYPVVCCYCIVALPGLLAVSGTSRKSVPFI